MPLKGRKGRKSPPRPFNQKLVLNQWLLGLFGAALAALRVIRADGPDLFARLLDNASYLREGLRGLGLQVIEPGLVDLHAIGLPHAGGGEVVVGPHALVGSGRACGQQRRDDATHGRD